MNSTSRACLFATNLFLFLYWKKQNLTCFYELETHTYLRGDLKSGDPKTFPALPLLLLGSKSFMEEEFRGNTQLLPQLLYNVTWKNCKPRFLLNCVLFTCKYLAKHLAHSLCSVLPMPLPLLSYLCFRRWGNRDWREIELLNEGQSTK